MISYKTYYSTSVLFLNKFNKGVAFTDQMCAKLSTDDNICLNFWQIISTACSV